MKAYEKILSHELDSSTSNNSQLQTNDIEQSDPGVRRIQMHQLIQTGLKKTEREAVAKQLIGDALQVVVSVKDIIDSAIQAVPQAALP